MKENSQFNIYHQFAGCFLPYGLMSRANLSLGAKVCYSLLAQQANVRGITQLNLPMLAASLGETEGEVARYLMELERTRLIVASRGNVNREDVRLFFPRHPWLTDLAGQAGNVSAAASPEESAKSQPYLFAIENAATQRAPEGQPANGKEGVASRRQGRKKRWFGRPRSSHSYEVCLGFITYQKKVLNKRSIYDPEGLADSIYHTGKQDEEIDEWLAEQADAA
jgi:hypothetical protein